MLQITKRTDYGLIALTHLALQRGQLLSARELAETYGLSRPLMANVLKALGREGVVRSVRGSRGGYELAMEPEAVSVGWVAEVLEGPLQLAQCIGDEGEEPLGCAASRGCPVKHSVVRIHLKIRDVLYAQSVADLVAESTRSSRQPLPLASPSGEGSEQPTLGRIDA